MINEHVKMTEELLQNSQFIVYVTASSLTDSDRRMIQNIGNLGIDMIFARTHVDEMRDSEEDVYSTIKQEQELLQQVIGTMPIYFALCNEQNSPEFERWVSQYEGFKEYVSQCLAAKIEEIYTRSTLGRLGIMKEKFEKALKHQVGIPQKKCGEKRGGNRRNDCPTDSTTEEYRHKAQHTSRSYQNEQRFHSISAAKVNSKFRRINRLRPSSAKWITRLRTMICRTALKDCSNANCPRR